MMSNEMYFYCQNLLAKLNARIANPCERVFYELDQLDRLRVLSAIEQLEEAGYPKGII